MTLEPARFSTSTQTTTQTTAADAPTAAVVVRPFFAVLLLAAGAVALDLLLPGLPVRGTGAASRVMALLSGICPQRMQHTYFLAGVQLPMEARMVGMFGGLAAGVLELITLGRERLTHWPRKPLTLALAIGFLSMALDGTNALFYDLGLPHFYAPNLRVRLATGILSGLAMAFALVPAVAQAGPVPTGKEVPGWRDALLALLGATVFGLLLASGWGVLLIPATFVIGTTVVLGLGLINRTVLGLVIPAYSGHFTPTWRSEWLLAAIAITLTVIELSALALLRGFTLPY